MSALVGFTLLYPSISIAFSVTTSPNVLPFTTFASASSFSVPCSL